MLNSILSLEFIDEKKPVKIKNPNELKNKRTSPQSLGGLAWKQFIY